MKVPAFAQARDCEKVIGRCEGLIELVRSFGSTKSFGAELIHSSEMRCSKVEYYVDGTPYQTILANRNKEPESVFGTKPITGENISFSACYICASASNQKSENPEPRMQRIADETAIELALGDESTNTPLDRELLPDEVVPGMVLSRDLLSPRGTLLLAAGFVFDARVVRQLRELAGREDAKLGIFVKLSEQGYSTASTSRTATGCSFAV